MAYAFRRLLPLARRFGARCLIEDSALGGRPDFLLHESDLPSPRTYFLKKTPIEEYEKECDLNHSGIFLICDEPGLLPILPTRLGIVLPLHVDSQHVYPLPFIIDTGTTGFFYLGKKCVEVLKSEGVLSDTKTSIKHEFLLHGSIEYEGHVLETVFADTLPFRYEPRPPDVRSNVMGLSAMWQFNMWNIRHLPTWLTRRNQ